MVTGACGTVGKQLVQQLLERFDVGELTGIDHNESELVFLEEQHAPRDNVRFLLCDVRDAVALMRETRRIDIIFHAAAYKHVYACERSPLEAVQTNILGVQNVLQAAVENGVERLVFTSSDKAVNPTNVMGTSKLMGERLVTAAAIHPNHSGATFLSTRFGNVLGSRGSVIPIFRDQIRKGGPVTLSDPRMTRFIMSLDEAVRLVIESSLLGEPGEVLITKMPAIRISDLAKIMIREYAPQCGHRPEDVELRVVGPKPGEKLYEELMNEEETRRAFEREHYFVIRPAMMARIASDGVPGPENAVERAYNSANVIPLSGDELAEFMQRNQLLSEERLTR
ncbi:MAG TPA: polysaccharide biosynthesis protein [Stellaceae bacterium]|nr:polysaccharide biosynthesis protein [Stellaceae bacterium]